MPGGAHLRAVDAAGMCPRLFLREVKDAGWPQLEEMGFCSGRL